ncbi:hypothetical protein GF312_12115 [Candidatus Poribacteria bacterium]|nr:hypothetical protein [Candidatus Poribacteria bacterium]
MSLLSLLIIPTILSSAVEEDFFPILIWDNIPENHDQVQEIADCGITVVYSPTHRLDLAHEYGLKAIVNDNRSSSYYFRDINAEKALENVKTLTEEVGSHPALLGYYLRDEPHADLFPGLALVSKAFLSNDPDKIPLINLFPNYASSRQLGTETYKEHVDKYIQTVDPAVICYDHYALMEYEPLREGYFANLETIRNAALKYKKPFWNVVLANAHFTYREPTAADMRFQVFTTLAYGGKGIGYFTYVARDRGNYRMSPIDQFGNRTATWYYMQNVNLMVHKLAPTLLKLTSTGVYHTGDIPEGCENLPGDTLIKSISGNTDFLIGEFKHSDGSDYVMIVNKSFQNSTPFRLEFNKSDVRLQRVSPYTGEIHNLSAENDWLAPGQGVLLKLAE